MTAFLASISNLHEATIALDAGVDIIDLKQPATGTLGAVSDAVVRAVVEQVNGRVPVSATIGDQPTEAATVAWAAEQKAAAGVDYVKIGLFGGGDLPTTLSALRALAGRGIRLVAVLFADQGVDLSVLKMLSATGFSGAMLDTVEKDAGSLRRHANKQLLRVFVHRCRRLGLLSGLAGSLGTADIAPLLKLSPDLLGFRGALCDRGHRTEALNRQAVGAVRALIPPQ
jgi:uncharacterized protein (UPF0264 family)